MLFKSLIVVGALAIATPSWAGSGDGNSNGDQQSGQQNSNEQNSSGWRPPPFPPIVRVGGSSGCNQGGNSQGGNSQGGNSQGENCPASP